MTTRAVVGNRPPRSERASRAPQPLNVDVTIDGDGAHLLAHSVRGISSVVRTDAVSLIEQSARICELIARKAGRNRELRDVVRDLSRRLLDPLEAAVDSCSEVIISLPLGALRIPIDVLTYRRAPLFLRRPVSYRIGRTSNRPFVCQSPCTALILSDASADPDRACLTVAKTLSQVTYQDDREATRDSLRLQTPRDVLVVSLHGRIGGPERDHLEIHKGRVHAEDLTSLRPRLAYLDSCNLGVSRVFIRSLRAAGTVYYVAPIVSNEAGDSSTRTMTMFFENLVTGIAPEVALFKTRRELWRVYRERDFGRRLWRAFPFRLYRLN